MRSAVRKQPNQAEWHDWYAWHPVSVTVGPGAYQWVWRETVQRINVLGIGGTRWLYRLRAA